MQYKHKQDVESVFANAKSPIFDPEKTAPIANSGLFFSGSNLLLSALAKFRFFNQFVYKNLSFGFFRYENRQGLETNFVHLFEGNSQVAIFE